MLGIKSSLDPVIAEIKEAGAMSWVKTDLCQGRTMRWAVAWTFLENIELSKLLLPKPKKQPPPLSYPITSDCWNAKGDYSIGAILEQILHHFYQLKVDYFVLFNCIIFPCNFFALDRNEEHQ